MADNNKIVDRCRKLLALTESPNEHEAALAMETLNRFLTEHNLSIADLEKKGAKAPPVGEHGYDLGKAAFKWKLDLAEGIAEHYYCAAIVNRKIKTISFVGRPDNVEALQMLYAWVIDQIKELSRKSRREHFDATGEHIDPLRWQLQFGEGIVPRLIDRLKEMKTRAEEDMSRDAFGNVTALAVHHQSEVSDFLEKEHGYRTDGKQTQADQDREKRWADWDKRREEEREKHDKLKAECEANGDMGPYYEAYPYNHPDKIAEAKAKLEKAQKEEDRKDRARERRRNASGYYEREDERWERKQERRDRVENDPQKVAARAAGKSNADKINLQPFVTDGKPKSKGAIG